MRKASYDVPKVSGDAEDGELAVFYFGPGQGGSIDANVDRWVKQFSGVDPGDVKRADREANGLRQHTVEVPHGTFDAGQMAMGASGEGPEERLRAGGRDQSRGAERRVLLQDDGPREEPSRRHAIRPSCKLLDSVRAGS